MGPKALRSTVLSAEEEAIVIAFRKYTLLPLDDCLYALQATIPHLTRSSLHRCLQRHGISRLPEVAGDKPARQPFKEYPIGYFHVDIAEVRTEEGKLHLFVAVDRTSKFAFAQLHGSATVKTASAFLEALVKAVPYKIHTVLTDNGVQFCDMPKHRSGPTARYRLHGFDRICREQDIEHRLTKPNHPWTNGQVERMNRTLKDATVRLGVPRLHIDGGRGGRWAPRAEHVGSPALKLGFPGGDLIGVDVEMLGQLGQCPIALDGGKRHLRLEGRGLVPACSSAHCRS